MATIWARLCLARNWGVVEYGFHVASLHPIIIFIIILLHRAVVKSRYDVFIYFIIRLSYRYGYAACLKGMALNLPSSLR